MSEAPTSVVEFAGIDGGDASCGGFEPGGLEVCDDGVREFIDR